MSAAVTFPVIHSRMGSTEYYAGTIPARDLAAIAIPVKELTEWQAWTIDERIQRDINERRVAKEIVPYLVNSPDRFFGSLIILVYEPDVFEFETVSQLGAHSGGAAYAPHMDRLGVLTVKGGHLVALDGQHRLVALREVVTSGDEIKGKYSQDVASDEVCVVIVPHESLEKTRRIFNKVNQHARPTSGTDNTLTSEDDGNAIVARWLVSREPPLGLTGAPPLGALHPKAGEPLVEWRSSSLKATDEKLSTLVTVARTVETILGYHGLEAFDEKHQVTRPPDSDLEKAYLWASEWWSELVTRFKPFQRSIANPTLIPTYRESTSQWSLAMRPVGQQAIFKGLVLARRLGVDLPDAVDGLNEISWRAGEDYWRDVIFTANNRLMNKQAAIVLASRVIGYMLAGDRMATGDVNQLQDAFAQAKGWDGSATITKLPSPVFGPKEQP